jgi:hypothetical protein
LVYKTNSTVSVHKYGYWTVYFNNWQTIHLIYPNIPTVLNHLFVWVISHRLQRNFSDPGLDRYSGVRQKRSLKISKGSTANFSTPRALHILASSAGYILFECVLWYEPFVLRVLNSLKFLCSLWEITHTNKWFRKVNDLLSA